MCLQFVFCDAHLKDSKEAKELLNGKYANSLRGDVVTGAKWLQK